MVTEHLFGELAHLNRQKEFRLSIHVDENVWLIKGRGNDLRLPPCAPTPMISTQIFQGTNGLLEAKVAI